MSNRDTLHAWADPTEGLGDTEPATLQPPARSIASRPGLLSRLVRAAKCWWLRWEIDSAERWIEQCRRDGITTSEQLRYQRMHVGELRCRLLIAEAS
jgi:hypothetical protein